MNVGLHQMSFWTDTLTAVHQCPYYPHNILRCHDMAVKHNGNYLISTKYGRLSKNGYRGLIVDPIYDLSLNISVDNIFYGLRVG